MLNNFFILKFFHKFVSYTNSEMIDRKDMKRPIMITTFNCKKAVEKYGVFNAEIYLNKLLIGKPVIFYGRMGTIDEKQDARVEAYVKNIEVDSKWGNSIYIETVSCYGPIRKYWVRSELMIFGELDYESAELELTCQNYNL